MSKPAKRCPKWFPNLCRAVHNPSAESDALFEGGDPDQVTDKKEKKEAMQVFAEFWDHWREHWMSQQPPPKPRSQKPKKAASSESSSKEASQKDGEEEDDEETDNVSHERPSKKRKQSTATPLPIRHKLNRVEQVMSQADHEFQTRFGATQQVSVTEVKAWFESVQTEFYQVLRSATSPIAMSPTLSPSPEPVPLVPAAALSSSALTASSSTSSSSSVSS